MITIKANEKDIEVLVDTAEEASAVFEAHAPGQQIDGLPDGAQTPTGLVGVARTAAGYVRVYARSGDGGRIWEEMF